MTTQLIVNILLLITVFCIGFYIGKLWEAFRIKSDIETKGMAIAKCGDFKYYSIINATIREFTL